MPERISGSDLVVGIRLLWGLPSFLRHPVTPQEARVVLRARFARREQTFLALARELIYAHPGSPYRRLLALAGCEYGDLERLVEREGLEGTLQTLFRRGVYLRVDEYKGRRTTVRGSTSFTMTPDQLRNPRASVHVRAETSGSRGNRTVVAMDLTSIQEKAVDLSLYLDARRAGNWVHACWTVPSTMSTILRMCGAGARPVRWFSQVDPAGPELHTRYAWGARLLAWGGRAARLRLPRPEYAPLDDPLPVLRWIAGELKAGRVPHIHTYPSSAVRLCEAAVDAGLDVQGVQFTVAGEPVSAARLARIRSAGAVASPHYAAVEGGHIAYACLAPQAADEMHLLHDLHGLIQPGLHGSAADLPPDALLLTSLRPTTPLVLLNVSLGDQATVVVRDCGCPLERLGWTTHLHTIQSHEKLTAGGMTFLDRDVARVLEEVLPRRFGGAPTDYQLVEDEAEDGRPRLRLLIDPRVGALDLPAVVHEFLAAIGAGSGAAQMMSQVWRDAGFLRVERHPPRMMPSGKILHVHPRPQRQPSRSALV